MADIARRLGIYPLVPVVLCDREWRIFPSNIAPILDTLWQPFSACRVSQIADAATLRKYFDAWDHAADRTPHGQPIELQPQDFHD